MLTLTLACGGGVLAEQVKLASGEVLTAKVVSATGQSITFVHPVLGEITLPAASATVLPEPPPPGSPEAKAAADQQLAEAQERVKAEEAAGPPAPAKLWKFKFTLGGGLTSGNTDTANVAVLFFATRETKETKLALDTGYSYGEADGTTNRNQFTFGGRNDWLNPGKKWFYFADTRYDWDEFQSWDSRITGHVGLGYKLIEPPKFKLNLVGGVGFNQEFGSPDERFRPEALFGVESKYDFSEKNSVVFTSTYYPDLSDIGEFRWVNILGWSWRIDSTGNLSLTIGLQDEYQSNVGAEQEYNDFRLIAGISTEF